MQTMFAVTLGKRRGEFSVVGVVDVGRGSVKFQGCLNGIPFTEGKDYEKIRARVVKAVEINSVEGNASLS